MTPARAHLATVCTLCGREGHHTAANCPMARAKFAKLKPNKKLRWAGWASILRILQRMPASSMQLSEEIDVGINSVRHTMNAMHDLRLVHVVRWERLHVKGGVSAVWAFGPGVDAVAESAKPGIERDKAARYSRRTEMYSFAAIMRALVEPVTMKTLMELSGATSCNLSRLIRHCRRIGLIRVAEWEVRTTSHGKPAMAFQFGNASDKPRPKTKPRADIVRESKARRKAREEMLAMISATCAPVVEAEACC